MGKVTQNVTAVAGFAYGVIGADIHVFPDRGPVYLLAEYRPHRAKPDTGWLLAQPSRLLNARFHIVDFTGRDEEQAELAAWRDAAGPRLAARWLYGPGGQGKTRLAAEFAAQSMAAGWKVITVTHGPGTVLPPPGSHNLELGDAAGVIVVVDYADRWPISHLTWLFSNSLLHRQVPARLLLLARSPYPWPPIRAALEELQAATDEHLLRPIGIGAGPDERKRMFMVARDCFAACYDIPDPGVIEPPPLLRHPDFGLVLTLHMAALAAVESHVQGHQPPKDAAGLSVYLLERERRHWTQLHENHGEGLEFRTPPEAMARVVFTAALTGATEYPRGKAILGDLDLELPPDRLLDDHTGCYPPSEPGAVLEPLYPDRLAEDFIALTLPGHTAAGLPARPWAFSTVKILSDLGPEGSSPAHISRTITFLAAAAGRWPHVTGHLSKILEEEPQLAVDAGTAALTALADLDLDPGLLEAVAERFPERHVDLDIGIAAVSAGLARRHSAATDPLTRANAHFVLVYRMHNAGLYQQAVDASDEAVRLFRQLAETDPAGYETDLAQALHNHGQALSEVGRMAEALTAIDQAVAVYRRLAAEQPADRPAIPGPVDFELATCLMSLGSRLSDVGREEEALAATEEATAIWRRLAGHDPMAAEPHLADLLGNLSIYLSGVGRESEALEPAEEAVAIYRRLAAHNPAVFEPNLSMFLANLSLHLTYAERAEEAVRPAEEAVAIYRRLAAHNPAAFEAGLARSLHNLGLALKNSDRKEESLAATEESVGCYRRAYARSPSSFEYELAASLTLFAEARATARRQLTEALEAITEATTVFQRLAEALPAAFEARLQGANAVAANVLDALGRTEEAQELRRANGLDDDSASSE